MNKEVINKNLQKEISRECMIKAAVKKIEERKAAARIRIEILQERKRLEDEYLCDYE